MPAALRGDEKPDEREQDRAQLFDIIFRKSFGRRKVVLSSGQESDFYFDMKPSMMDPRGAHLIAVELTREIARVGADYVGGLEMGAVPITGAVCQYSFQTGQPLHGLFVRKKPKSHGAMNTVEGLGPGESLSGKRVVIVEDVTTSGASALLAVRACIARGAQVVLAITIVDRGEGSAATFASERIPFRSLFRASEFLSHGS